MKSVNVEKNNHKHKIFAIEVEASNGMSNAFIHFEKRSNKKEVNPVFHIILNNFKTK